MERWLPITGYEGFYEVSDDGRVRSLRFVNGQANLLRPEPLIMAPHVKSTGHTSVLLCGQGHARRRYVHVAMLEAFVGSCPPGQLGTHDDGDASHNSLGNLVWGTQKKNMADKIRHGTAQRGERANGVKLTTEQVLEIRRSPLGCRRLARAFGVSAGQVKKIRNGTAWSHV